MSNFPPVTELPPNGPQVIIAFHGLMAFRFKSPSPQSAGFCEVAMHGDAARHNFTVKVFDLTNGSSDPFNTFNFGPAGSAAVDRFRIDAVNADPPDVKFYQPESKGKEDTDPDPLDFRQVIDFEGPNFYARDLQKNEGVFRPRLILKTGTFVTLVRSLTHFKRQAPFDELSLGQIAEIVGAGIYLKPDGLVALRFGQQEVRLELKPTGDTLYLVLFDNSCPTTVCKFQPGSPIKEERNDFFEYYKMFTIPEDGEEFELVLDSSKVPAAPESSNRRAAPKDPYETARNFLRDTRKESNNEAPCGPGAFGGG